MRRALPAVARAPCHGSLLFCSFVTICSSYSLLVVDCLFFEYDSLFAIVVSCLLFIVASCVLLIACCSLLFLFLASRVRPCSVLQPFVVWVSF